MGRKIDIKKIENVTKCQITFSKRRNGLIKKANEIAVCCEDVALLAFSPSGRISKYSNQRRIEDVLDRYVNLSADKRLNHITNVQEKLEKLKQIDHIKGDNKKLHFLEKQIENLELQIKKRGLELQILEGGLRDYVPGNDQEPSLHQLLWCERNLQHSLERVMARKNALLGLSASDQIFQNVDLMDEMEIIEDNGVPFASNFNETVLTSAMQKPSSSQILTELDPWISPYSAQAGENMLQNLIDGKCRPDQYNPRPSDTSNFHLAGSSAFFEPAAYIPQQQPSSMANQSLLEFPDQNIDSWKNLSAVATSDLNHNLVKNPSNFMPTRFTSTTVINTSDAGKSVDQMPHSEYYQTETGFEYAGSNLSNFTSMQEGDIGLVLPNMYSSTNFSKGTSSNIYLDGNGTGNFNEGINKEDESHASFVVPPFEEVDQDQLFGSFQTDQGEDNSFWASKIQKTSSWDWDELLWEENFSETDFKNNIE